MMRHILTTSIIMAAVSFEATTIDAIGAKQVAADIYQELHSGEACPEMQIVAIDSLHSSPTYYVCQPLDAPGYFIISAVEGTPELIAYSETGSYQYEQPAPFLVMLSNYADRLAEKAARLADKTLEQAETNSRHIAQQGAASVISPLIKSYWAQGGPYNLLCPEIDGQHTLTGCNATALAQVLYYHKYPAVATGTGTATLNNQRLTSIDLSQFPLLWDQMLNTYQGVEYSEEQANAVATLMKVCGYSVNMDYRLDYSGAYVEYSREALVEKYGYSPQARLYLRNSYEKACYLALIHSELEAGRPIIVAGQFTVSRGGHAFVCDGYGVRNTLHINWGWGEGVNNSVDIDFLAPNGYNESYNKDLKMLMGIQPRSEAESSTLPYNLDICDSLKFTASNKMYVFPAVYNSAPEHVSLSFGFCIRKGNEVVQFIDLNKKANIQFMGHSSPIYGVLSLPQLEDGDYTLQMVVKPQNSTDWMTVNPGDRTDGFTFSISNGVMTFGELTTIGMVDTTAIESLHADTNNAAGTYSLSGARIETTAPVRGLSIHNGKILFVK